MGLMPLKEKNNSQGLFDMGICPKLGVGSQDINDKDLQKKLKKTWKVKELSDTLNECQYDSLEKGVLKNMFIFGEDPLGCAQNKVKVSGWLSVADFVMVQDYFMTDTAKHADLILPASLPFEMGGSFTNTQKVIQEFETKFGVDIHRMRCHSWEEKRVRGELLVRLKDLCGLTYREIKELSVFNGVKLNSMAKLYRDTIGRRMKTTK